MSSSFQAKIIVGIRLREGPGQTLLVANTAQEFPLDSGWEPQIQIKSGKYKDQAKLFHTHGEAEEDWFFGVELCATGKHDSGDPQWSDIPLRDVNIAAIQVGAALHHALNWDEEVEAFLLQTSH